MISVYLALLTGEWEEGYFRKLYTRYETELYQIALSALSDTSLAEDAVQESWLWVAEKFCRVLKLEPDLVGGYLTVVVKRVCSDFNRRKTPWEELPEDWDIAVAPAQGTVLDMVVALIGTMPAQYREILERKYVLGVTLAVLLLLLVHNPSSGRTVCNAGKTLAEF